MTRYKQRGVIAELLFLIVLMLIIYFVKSCSADDFEKYCKSKGAIPVESNGKMICIDASAVRK